MSLLLTLEQGPRAQVTRQARLDEGELVIGRSADADWQINDPDMFVSRAHCKITSKQGGYFVTDTSSSGLFIDDASSPLGAGNTERLQSGMRLRLGDYVVCVDLQTAKTEAPALRPSMPASKPVASRAPVSLGGDDFFSSTTQEEPGRPRPADLPDPFEKPVPGAFARADERSSQAFDDPFSLDPVATPAPEAVTDKSGGKPLFDDPFGLDSAPLSREPSRSNSEQPPAYDDGFGFGPAESTSLDVGATDGGAIDAASPAPSAAPWELPARAAEPSPKPTPQPPPRPPVRQAAARPSTGQPDAGLRAAFLRGMGMDEAGFPGRNPVADMEKFGREYRLMMDGLMQLLRKRAEEKGNARVAQTVVGASEVNPLKFLPSVDDALVTMLAERSPGFLGAEAAIKDAVRDLAQHHVRAWRGVQGALKRMIDRFDPAAIEQELKSSSAIGNLLTGGRGAKLWELYQKRHREIAHSAETRFLGEIGADFRDAYEED
ncbi:type VI secretion protein [Mesorhizobium sp. LSJC268A00]|uniref:type VI secretion system-associated FHA domain protein TagH n=1 Tax=unclassified Mesorhizobium TaxID=325217 RepID=UPI0003CE9A9E|nr:MULTISPECIES: type VI secretion system-associated FHA domain protein TagH [unclassified Mesorhizobium]ESW67925.1 type VI secretion protein [Mesorhizobium sp. LSJC277A00]ESX04225.1 type VI secretion protein [Mesorhizobium sp. LSJC268A00]ESZ14637.1 type VI secretion protein [Mesorhizobium sp. L2C085B000]ESZ67091.1 type VI secretion protein [Mesorhizobium sp. L103C120A0]WJI44261.1 type VI secretion system-associated FHA domain protein TagH [Mesorhizobium sp. C120A]